MAKIDGNKTVTLQELMVSTLAMVDAVTKLLIEKGVISEEEFKEKLSEERATKTLQSNTAMNIADILIWEAANGLLLIPVLIALVMLTRWIRGRPVFTEHDWLFLTGYPREKILSLHLWLRFAALWLAVVLIGFVEGYVLLPFGFASFLGAVLLTALVVWRLAPKWLSRLHKAPVAPISWV